MLQPARPVLQWLTHSILLEGVPVMSTVIFSGAAQVATVTFDSWAAGCLDAKH